MSLLAHMYNSISFCTAMQEKVLRRSKAGRMAPFVPIPFSAKRKKSKTILYKRFPPMYNIAKRGSGQVTCGSSPSSEPQTVEGGKGTQGEITRERGREKEVAASGGPPLQGHTSGRALGFARRVVPRKIRSFAPYDAGAEDLLFSKNSWRSVCTTRYRRI